MNTIKECDGFESSIHSVCVFVNFVDQKINLYAKDMISFGA